MSEWIMVHPWMTFFLALTVIEMFKESICAICEAISSRNSRNQDNYRNVEEASP